MVVCLWMGIAVAEEIPLTLVSEGQVKAVVVLPAAPSPAAVAGSGIFAEVLFRMSGARPAILKETDLGQASIEQGRLVLANAPGAQALVLIGESELARRLGTTCEGLGPGGVVIKTFPNGIMLMGPDAATPSDPWGTRYAVTLFLENALACRYLWPGESGLIIPRRKTVQIPHMDRRMTPLLRQRQIRSITYSPQTQIGLDKLGFTRDDFMRLHAEPAQLLDTTWFGWHRMGGSLGLISGHAFGYVWEKYSKEHPDWFALQPNGSRDQSQLGPSRARLCKSNQDLIAAIAQDKIEELNSTRRGSAAIGPNDGGRATFCTCPECRKLDPPQGRKITLWDYSSGQRKDFEYVSLTDRTAYFWNGIAELVAREHPEAILTADGYSAYVAPPIQRSLHPNIAIRFAGISYSRDEARRTGRADWEGWARACSKLYWRPNLLLAARREGTPVIYVHKLAEDFRYMAHHSMIGTDFDACVHNWATQGLNYYILARLHWDPDLDVDSQIDDYCRAGFGSAAEHVKHYLLAIEQATDRIAAEELSYTQPYTPQVVARLRQHLDDATGAASGDEPVQQRIAFLLAGLDYTDVQARCYDLLAAVEEKGLTPELRAQAKEAMDRKFAMMRRIFREHPLAVNVAYVAAMGEGRFGKLGWTRPAAPSPDIDADALGLPIAPPAP